MRPSGTSCRASERRGITPPALFSLYAGRQQRQQQRGQGERGKERGTIGGENRRVRDGGVFPLPQRDKYIFLTGGCYIYSTERVAQEGEETNKKRERVRKDEKTGAKHSICEIFGAIVRLRQLPFPGRFKGLLNISVGAAGLWLLLCRFCVFPSPGRVQFLLAAPAGG